MTQRRKERNRPAIHHHFSQRDLFACRRIRKFHIHGQRTLHRHTEEDSKTLIQSISTDPDRYDLAQRERERGVRTPGKFLPQDRPPPKKSRTTPHTSLSLFYPLPRLPSTTLLLYSTDFCLSSFSLAKSPIQILSLSLYTRMASSCDHPCL